MTKLIQDDSDAIICDCTGTTYKKVQQLIDDGADSLETISDATGVCTGCASCDILVMELLDDNLRVK